MYLRLIAVFLGLCSVIALVFAGADALVQRRHRQWPTATAVVTKTDIREYHPFTREGGGVVYSIEATVTPIADPQHPRLVRSSSAYSAAVMNAWIERHRPGSMLDVRLDPHDARTAELVDTEDLPMEHHPKQDLELAAGFAAGCVVLALLSRLRVNLPS